MRRVSSRRVQASSTETFPAPSQGWVQSGNIVTAPREAAERLDNFIPTAQGARVRGGCRSYADIGAPVVQLFSYSSGGVNDLFAGTASALFDVDRVALGGANTFGDVEGLTSGDWSGAQIASAGGQFLVTVNGADFAHFWNGATWNPITGEAVFDLPFDAQSAPFSVGQTVTGGTSGATSQILGIVKTSAAAGTLRLGAITGGPFQDNEALTDGLSGAAVAAGAGAAGSTVAITGVTTSSLSQVWLFKERLFFVEGDTTSYWYLPVESIGGVATEVDLGSVFARGGSLLFGTTWSLDSGAGLDDVCLFVSDQGEVAVYEGSDPSNAANWSLVGVYEIGQPLNKHAYFKAGGDLAVLTKDGIIPISEALQKDRAALQSVAVSYPIEDAWRNAIAGATRDYPVSVSLWQSQTLLLVGTPALFQNLNVSFMANARTGAWGRITGWDVRCSEVSGDTLYFGSENGKVYEADAGGSDDGTAYSGFYVPKFSASAQMRSANSVGITYRATGEAALMLEAMADYKVTDLAVPEPLTAAEGATWGSGVWGQFVWGSGNETDTFTAWQSASANGYSLAPAVAVSLNQSTKPEFEVLMTRLRSERGYPL